MTAAITMPAEGRIAATSSARGMTRADGALVEWRVAEGLVGYDDAVATMERRVAAIAGGAAAELVWLVEHPPLYTAGTSSGPLAIAPMRFPIHPSGRGGQVTYHGPGQRVAYVMLDLAKRRPDVRTFVAALERWIIATLAAFAIHGERRDDRVGVWVTRPDKAGAIEGAPAEDKIGAIGIRVRRWVTFHGIAINVEPDLTHYRDITPCGIQATHLGVTSFVDLGHIVTMAEVDDALRDAFSPIFGATC